MMKPSEEALTDHRYNLLAYFVQEDPDLDGDFIMGYDEDEDWHVGLD